MTGTPTDSLASFLDATGKVPCKCAADHVTRSMPTGEDLVVVACEHCGEPATEVRTFHDGGDACPDCAAPIREKWSGVDCSANCGWWYCA